MKKILPILFFLILTILLTSQGSAQETGNRSLTISPPGKEINVNPGDTSEGILKLKNDSDQTISFTLTIRDYVVKDNQGTPEVLPPNTLSNKYSAASWVGVYPSDFVIAPHSTQEIQYFLQVPLDARPGGHYSAVMYESNTPLGVQGTGAGVNTFLGTLFYINVSGDINENATVKQFKANGFNENGPVTITTEIQNNGDLHVKPRGTITVKNMLGQVVETKQLSEHNIFPEKSFLQEEKVGQKWMIGRYTAQLAATYGQNNNLPLVATTSFIVFPWKISVVVVLVIVIIVLLIIAMKRRKKGHSHETETTTPESHPNL